MQESNIPTFNRPKQKALKVNLDDRIYGTFAEIGAGQEVARYFFQVGGASHTVAKTMSAYDMVFSDSIYGRESSGRYVVETRLRKMLAREYDLLLERLQDKRPPTTLFFTFANTVATGDYDGVGAPKAHGWMGLRFQYRAGEPFSEVIMHVRMLDHSTLEQQEVLGVIGVNLIHSCFFIENKAQNFVKSLFEDITGDSLEIDALKVSGPAFEGIDDRILCLQLVKNGMSNAVMFNNKGQVIHPSEALYKKNILVQRGRFRPPTLVAMDMLTSAFSQFKRDLLVEDDEIMILPEITMKSLGEKGEVDESDFLSRVELLGALGHFVLISNYHEHFRLSSYLSQHTKGKIGMVIGIQILADVFNPKSYEYLPGGLLQALGVLFSNPVKMYVYPLKDKKTGTLRNCLNLELAPILPLIFEYFCRQNQIVDITDFNGEILDIISDNVIEKIIKGESGWEDKVPAIVVETIREKCLFGYPCCIYPGEKKPKE